MNLPLVDIWSAPAERSVDGALDCTAEINRSLTDPTNADGVPLATYPPAAAQTIVALFALSSLARLIICLMCVIVLVKYRRAIPFMFVILGLTYLGAILMQQFIPIVRVGTPPGVIVNLISFGLIVVGFLLSLWKRPSLSES